MGRVLLEPGVEQAAVSALAANAESVVAHLIMGPLLLGLRWIFSLAPFFKRV
ncbi:hypothetical protein ATPR_2540 [Acetobacter tropicalis NBRC 101654]|uniref:Uncharacterized protein n=1 Tax=Acetobacter tropicalis NBRC 101654 TaxID=749388 RepID=F7VGP1_9PROT|nr:hypothetical protein ATPR_2540 [Acetobacter tropicalis NBRC 101654]